MDRPFPDPQTLERRSVAVGRSLSGLDSVRDTYMDWLDKKTRDTLQYIADKYTDFYSRILNSPSTAERDSVLLDARLWSKVYYPKKREELAECFGEITRVNS